jgi:hypothetical protein
VKEKRAPDPFRPGEIPAGRPYAKAGSTGNRSAVVALIVLVALTPVVYALVK